jgi:hypothetical protein
MAIFNDLAIELQEAIWELVLPTSRGVHWIEVEGIPQEPEYVRESIRITQSYRFDRMPQKWLDVYKCRRGNSEFSERDHANPQKSSSPFFRYLLTTVPAAIGQSADSEELERELADEIAHTSRCKQLSTYYQIATLLSLCRLSRSIALRYIKANQKCSWPIRRSMGALYRPRPMELWETQYSGDMSPSVSLRHTDWQLLRPRIHTLDLAVFRLHDSQGRATPLLKHAPWQYWTDRFLRGTTFACFNHIGLEWHPSWGTFGGRNELRPENIHTLIETMQGTRCPITLYWLVDGVPRPNWKQDYPAVVQKIFAARTADDKSDMVEHFDFHWKKLRQDDHEALLSDSHHLGQEFEANGRRYYVVFVVFDKFHETEKDELTNAGLGWSGPFPGSAAMWPEAVREPVRLAYDVCRGDARNLGTRQDFSYILSWEPIGHSTTS